MRFNPTALCLTILMLASARTLEAKRPIRFEDLMEFQRLSDPQISPDGRWVAFVVNQQNLENNDSHSHLWLVPFLGGEPKQLTRGNSTESRPRWSPESRSLAFISSRSGSSQVWRIYVEGGEAWQVTKVATGASGVVWSRRGDQMLITSRVFAECTEDACNKEKLDQQENGKVKARLLDELLFRHWDHWRDDRYTHLLVGSADRDEVRDLTPGPTDSPTWSLGGMDGYDISPDGQQVCYTSNRDPNPAASTNNDLFLVGVTGGEARKITTNPGSDTAPRYSPDGRFIAYLSQERGGFESDRNRLMIYARDTGVARELRTGLDISLPSFVWAPNSRTIYFTASERGTSSVFRISLTGQGARRILSGATHGSVQPGPEGRSLVFTRQKLNRAVELYRSRTDGSGIEPLTNFNQDLVAELEMNPGESFETTAPDGATIHGFLLKPPGFDPEKTYPALLLIHGGPQGAWSDSFHYRWNAQMFATRGYVVLMPNPRGSTGYGLKFMEEISGDWGGKCYEDLMAATDALAALPYVDGNRIGAAGGSFGGYMANWIAGHTNRFRTLVSHAGVYDQRSMYGSTEELWFPEWEFRGVPWENPELYEKWSPSNFADRIQTPMLLIHGEHDYRVPLNQALQLFTALKRRGIPSRFLYYPDEGHWVLKPQNSRLWYKTLLDWLDSYLKP